MTISTLTDISRHELAHRVGGGLEITLYWRRFENSIGVEIYDTAAEETTAFPVPAERALDAFHHPFAYMAELDAVAAFHDENPNEPEILWEAA